MCYQQKYLCVLWVSGEYPGVVPGKGKLCLFFQTTNQALVNDHPSDQILASLGVRPRFSQCGSESKSLCEAAASPSASLMRLIMSITLQIPRYEYCGSQGTRALLMRAGNVVPRVRGPHSEGEELRGP